MDAKFARFSLFVLFSTTALAAACNFDRFSDDTDDPCNDIKLDTKKKYKKGKYNNLELHVRLCQICEYNCDMSMEDFTDKMKNVTETCNGDKGCTKRFISWKGCPYYSPSEYYDPKCFFDDRLEKIPDEPCTDIGDPAVEGQDPAEKWDAKHQYDLLQPPNTEKFQRELRFLLKNAFEDVCTFPNTFDVVGAIIGALMCILKGCTKRYMGWRLCPADSDHALFAMTIEVGGAAAIADFLNKMAETFGRLVNGETFGHVNFTMLDDAFNITGTLLEHKLNISDVVDALMPPCF
ncbi:hypothetical protein AAVH_24011 [Aphelenchoides avenae]|nr:hypothetical protein AAVH_24011 [Aphelenchus avenae]